MVLASETCGGGGEGGGDGEGGELSLHAALVAAAAAAGGGRRRAGVWREHSYARAAAPPAAPTRLLAPPAAAPEPLVVDDEPAPPPALPHDAAEPEPEPAPDDDEPGAEAEARAAAAAPSAAHGRLLARALHILHDLRLARLAAPYPRSRALTRDLIKVFALKLRRALAPAWWWGGAAWVLGALPALQGRAGRAALGELVGELRRAAPRLGARLPPALASAPPPPPDPLQPAAQGGGRPARAEPLLLWVSAGRNKDDERWSRRLRALLPTRVVRAAPLAPPAHPAAALGPDRWAAALAADTRAALHDALLDAGGRAVVVCGFGAGAALAAALADGAGAAGAALLGGATAAAAAAAVEGGALLLVLGGGAAGRAAGAARAAAGPRRRLVLLEGADAALRVPHRLRRRLRVPQAALDAAVVEEVYRWAIEVADAEATDGSDAAVEPDEEEFVNLPTVTSPPPPSTPSNGHGNTRAIEIVEGRVVTRVSGGTPLLLPRRAAPAPAPPAAPAPADIMNMPIVFADDEPAPAPAAEAAVGRGRRDVCVVAGGGAGGALQYTRVIVAKRGGPAPHPAPRAAPRAARPVLLRRPHSLAPRPRPRPPPPHHARRH